MALLRPSVGASASYRGSSFFIQFRCRKDLQMYEKEDVHMEMERNDFANKGVAGAGLGLGK